MPYATVGGTDISRFIEEEHNQVFDCGLLTLMLDLQYRDIYSKPSMNSYSWSWIIIIYVLYNRSEHSTFNFWLYFISFFFFFSNLVICLWKTDVRAEADWFRAISDENIMELHSHFTVNMNIRNYIYILLLSSPITIQIIQCARLDHRSMFNVRTISASNKHYMHYKHLMLFFADLHLRRT